MIAAPVKQKEQKKTQEKTTVSQTQEQTDDQIRQSYEKQLESVLSQGMDAVVSIGTTSVFPYIAGPVLWAARQGVPTIEINPGDTTVSAIVDHRLRMCAAEALPALWRRMHPAEPAEDRPL